MRNPGEIPWWHDLIIVLLLVALGVVGVAALWGDRIRGLVQPERPEAVDRPADAPRSAPPPAIPGTSL